MTIDIDQLLRQPETEAFDRKSALNPNTPQDYLDLVADLVAMANTFGGSILIGSRHSSIPTSHLQFFDSARIDDKVNSLTEPRIGGIKSSPLDQDFILVEIEKSQNPPHVFKHDGNYMNEKGKNVAVFRRSDIYARHSSKSERATRPDFDRWFEERQRRLFENVRLVFEASPQAHIQVSEGQGGIPVRIAPDAPDAQAVFDLLTPDPFRDLNQELIGALKAWKTSHQLLNEPQIYKAYLERKQTNNPEILELLLRSSWERHMQGYYWTAKLDANSLIRILGEVMTADLYPAAQEALKVAALLPRDHAKPFFALVDASKRKSMKKTSKKLQPVLRARGRKYDTLIEILCPGQNLTYIADEGLREVNLRSITEGTLDEILRSLLQGKKENRGVFKAAELLVYGHLVTGIHFPTLELPEERPTGQEAPQEFMLEPHHPTSE